MKTRSSLPWLASLVLGCTTLLAQQDAPPPGGTPPPIPPPGAPGAPGQLAPPRGEQGQRPPGFWRGRGENSGPREGGMRRDGGPDGANREGGPGGPGGSERPFAPRDGAQRDGGPHDGGPRGEGSRDADAGPGGHREGGPRDGGQHEGGPGGPGGPAPHREGGPHDGIAHDGIAHEGGPRDGFRGHDGMHGPQIPRAPQPFLGVMAQPVPPPLAAQLGLTEGFGLLVGEVLPDSPAATAGLQKFDVLKLLNDQQLVDPAQLATLVRGAGKDKEVSLTVIRKAQEQKLTAKIGERVLPFHAGFGGPGEHGPVEFERMHEMQQRMHERGDEIRRHMEEMRHRQGGGPETDGGPRAEVSPEEMLREARPDGGSQVQVVSESGITTVDGAKSRLRLKDKDGEIEVVGENGTRTLTARDAQGNVVFTGPVDTAEQRKAVPEAYRTKLEEIHLRPAADSALVSQTEGDVQ